MSDPWDLEDDADIERLSLDVRAKDLELLKSFAAYRNALAAAQGKNLRKKWTRKSLAESLLRVQCDSLRQQMADMLAELGPLPDPKQAGEMEKYARRVIHWQKKNAK